MLKLSARRIKAANEAYAKGREEISEELYSKSNRALETILAGKKRLTRLEIAEHFRHSGLVADNYHMTRFMVRAEVEGIVCGGESKGGKHAYMLLGRVRATCAGHNEGRGSGTFGKELFP